MFAVAGAWLAGKLAWVSGAWSAVSLMLKIAGAKLRRDAEAAGEARAQLRALRKGKDAESKMDRVREPSSGDVIDVLRDDDKRF